VLAWGSFISAQGDESKEYEMSGACGTNAFQVLVRTLKGKKNLEALSVDLCIILKRIFKKY
jgi:hypothetical protein